MTSTPEMIEIEAALRQGGVQASLQLLNSRVAHRYTAIYQIKGDSLHNLFLHDRLGELRPEFLAVVPFADSFCQFVLRDGVFLTDNSAHDIRLDGHKYQGVMVSYHAIPLTGNNGELFGTMCHFDVVERQLPTDEFENFKRAARVITPYVLRGV